MANQNPAAANSATTTPAGAATAAAGSQASAEDTTVLSRFAPEQIVVQPIDPELAAEQAALAARQTETAAGEPAAPAGASPTANPTHQAAAAATPTDAKLPAKSSAKDGKDEVAKADTKPPARSMAEIEAEMAATRERLAATVGQLQEALQPKNLLRLQVEKVKGFYVDEYGAVRPERVAGTVGVVVVSVVVVKVVKRIF